MATAPVLLIVFNRPDRVRRLVESLRPHAPECIRVAVDGPRQSHPSDAAAVSATLNELGAIDWTSDVTIHTHSENLGISTAIPWAISWVLKEFEHAIIIEEDVTVGPNFLAFATAALTHWAPQHDVYSISGYNMVPPSHITQSECPVRYSRLVHSYAWATWRRAWEHYDPSMQWFAQQSTRDLAKLLGTRWAALRWKQFAAHVRRGRVSTWDYQWAMSIWSQNGKSVMPNNNLISYNGQTEGTHTFRSRSWSELATGEVDLAQLASLEPDAPIDALADSFAQQYGQRATPIGVALGYLEAPAMFVLRWWKRLKRQ